MYQAKIVLEIAYYLCLGLLALFILIFLVGKEKAVPGLLRALSGKKRYNFERMRIGILIVFVILFVIEALGLIYHEKGMLTLIILAVAALLTGVLGIMAVEHASRLKTGEKAENGRKKDNIRKSRAKGQKKNATGRRNFSSVQLRESRSDNKTGIKTNAKTASKVKAGAKTKGNAGAAVKSGAGTGTKTNAGKPEGAKKKAIIKKKNTGSMHNSK